MLLLPCSIYCTSAQAQGSLFLKIQLNRGAAAPEVITEWVYSFSIVYTEGSPSSVNTTQVSCIIVQTTFSVKKITNATHYHHSYKNCSCLAFVNREHGRALSHTAQPCTHAWPGWWKLSVWNEPVQHQYNSRRGFKHSRCQKNHSLWEAHAFWLSFLEAHCLTCAGVPNLMLLHWNKKSKWKDQYQIQE